MHHFIQTLKQSLQVRISIALILMFLPLSIIAGAFSYYQTYHEAEELQDDLLRQTAAYINPKTTDYTQIGSENHILIQTFGQEDTVPLSNTLGEGFHTIKGGVDDDDGDDDDEYRAYIHQTPQGKIAVLQETEYRDDLAATAAYQSVLPLLIALPLMILLTVWITYRAMRPVKTLSASLGQRRSDDLSPLDGEGVPSEIQGFVTAINQLLQRTGENIRRQQRFIADAAHELRSPLTALSLQAERLTKLPQSDEAREQTGLILQSIQRNRHLLEQLLTHARAQGSETQRNLTDISLQAQFRRVLQELMPLALNKQQDIGVAVENDLRIRADDTEIYTLIKTFTDNAIRYTPAGGRIDIGFSETPTTLTIWVEDDGPGIPAAERSRVTDAFYRILGTEQQGTGLGLSIADAIAKRYGGKLILADSRNFAHGLLIQAELNKQLLQAD
ncbi:MAG: two-component sensor histidine kinase [Neisseria sp.]|jgi:sensor histidine kinase|uniref:histidine kinase n=1 Tax=Neisseria mucosa (strain ATCC 25996 / DSM 4631 / NCTC 10774 / M26) TaxID=546266 RepID=D2ZTD4_NEIM2|nr:MULTISPECIES: ATP-binding protein [Neisseria]MBS5836267.1 two-component sensor histidine kinase [Neisseria sp.]OFN38941.1 two-component sensor histidine kinase [Neisseria sp. HMSC059F02]OHR42461.1 two-component sensor histidine kinase [Neisseria sp. HMSC070E12]EFC89454.1 ATPase/histidine kinase/DNA gyrase B/HSP90 domain protein [Neisseria mucosa ATCC 25996]MBS6045006.1 two-component sensor histidine kinase [Neisseria sp.]